MKTILICLALTGCTMETVNMPPAPVVAGPAVVASSSSSSSSGGGSSSSSSSSSGGATQVPGGAACKVPAMSGGVATTALVECAKGDEYDVLWGFMRVHCGQITPHCPSGKLCRTSGSAVMAPTEGTCP